MAALALVLLLPVAIAIVAMATAVGPDWQTHAQVEAELDAIETAQRIRQAAWRARRDLWDATGEQAD